MIEWMQKHKKYLVITIWVSAIAFIGAGFVGWGSVNFGRSGGSIAKVGDIEVSKDEFDREYSRLYNLYYHLNSGNFDQAKAKEIGLAKEALQTLIDRAYIRNYSKENGIVVSEEEVAEQIAKMKPFLTDGVFDREKYKRVLNQNGIKISSFEEDIKHEIEIRKITELLKPNLTDLEKKSVVMPLEIADRVEMATIDINDFNPAPNQDEIRSYWEENRDMFLSPKAFKLNAIIIPYKEVEVGFEDKKREYEKNQNSYVDSEGKILSFEDAESMIAKNLQKAKANKEILRSYLRLKNGEEKNAKEIVITAENNPYGEEFLKILLPLKAGESVKSIEIPEGVMTFVVKEIVEPKPLPFEKAKEAATKSLIKKLKESALKESVKERLKNFSGKDIGFVKRGDIDKIPGLREYESAEFLTKLFDSLEKKGVVYLKEKAVVYNILEQKLLKSDRDKGEAEFLVDSVRELKFRLIEEELLNRLKKKYDSRIFVKFE